MSVVPTYHTVRKSLHWLIAILLCIVIPLGLIIHEWKASDVTAVFGDGVTMGDMYYLHKSFGMLILCVMMVRIGAKLVWPAPEYVVPLTDKEKLGSTLVHIALYCLLFAVPVLGWLGTSAFGPGVVDFFGFKFPDLIAQNRDLAKTLFFLHTTLVKLLIGLALLHIAAGLYHGFVKKDGLLKRMWR